MGFAFRLMIFIMTFNLAIGVTTYMFGATPWLISDIANISSGSGGQVGLIQAQSLNQTMGQAGSVPIEETSFWYRFLDVISLGFYNKVKDFANATIFSIPNLCFKLHLIPSDWIIYLNAFIMTVFILGIMELFTGKDLTIR